MTTLITVKPSAEAVAPYKPGDNVLTIFTLDDPKVEKVRAVTLDPKHGWVLQLEGRPSDELIPAVEFFPVRKVQMYVVDDEGGNCLCAKCVAKLRSEGAEVVHVSELNPADRHDCDNCDAFQPAKGEYAGW